MMTLFNRTIAFLLLVCTTLGACGGGGGSGGDADSAPLPEPPVTTPAPEPVPTFSLTGVIAASESQAIDSDTNDLSREAVGNNSLTTAQRVPNPITIGGYVNLPLSGAPGQSEQDGDRDDYYQVDLLAGQRITMLVANFEAADADLYLLDEAGEIIDFSLETGEVESIEVEADGTYFINVFAFFGATNYILAIGNSTENTTFTRASAEFVPWQAVVKYRNENTGHTLTEAEMDRGMGIRMRAGGRGRERLMTVDHANSTARARLNRLGAAIHKRGAIADDDMSARWETLMMIKHLRADPMVEYASPNYRVTTLATPNDISLDLQWHYPLIALPEAWDTTTGSEEIVVAVIDTGIVAGHPDLAGQFVDGFDFVSDPVNAADGNGIDGNPNDPGSAFGGGVGSYHGTHVSGTIAARGDNRIGVAGTAYSSRVMPLRALGIDGGGTAYDVNQAVRYAAALPNDSGTVPSRAAAIINLSLGGGLPSAAEENLFAAVRDAGVIVVAAAGNSATTQPFYPAAYDGVISVSAVDTQRRIAPYSNTGRTIDVAAPGGNNSVDLTGDGYPDGILSTGASGSGSEVDFVYAFLNGTSMAAPHVAGVLALMKSVNPDLSPQDIDALLVAGALTDDLGVTGRDDTYGHGLINARQAVDAALISIGQSPADNPRLLASANTLNFGASTNALNLTLRNGGNGDLTLVSVDSAEPWLSVAATDVDASGLGDYTITADRSNLAPGIYATDIVAQSSVNAVSVRVFVSVFGQEATSDVGVLYILLYDIEQDSPIEQFVSTGDAGAYAFRFSDIPAGQYQILAGTDSDNDLFICDAGEACGAWLSTDQPITIELSEDATGLNFPVEYRVQLPTAAGAESTAGTATGDAGPGPVRPGVARLPSTPN